MKVLCPYCGEELTVFTEQRIQLNIDIDYEGKIIEYIPEDNKYIALNREYSDFQCRCFSNGCYNGSLRELISEFPNCIRRE